jgi:hypothetical protein
LRQLRIADVATEQRRADRPGATFRYSKRYVCMSAFITPEIRRRLKSRRTAVAGIAAVAATTVALSLAPSGDAEAGVKTEAAAAAAPVAWKADAKQVAAVHESITSQKSAFEAQLKATQAKAKAAAEAKARRRQPPRPPPRSAPRSRPPAAPPPARRR